jgi:predicted house-cleaning noncanonical NTP pyrophosphatase (MazG superfamily)
MNRTVRINEAKRIIREREENSEDLSPAFLEGFREGVAEFIAAQLKESASDILEAITTPVYP